MNKLNEVKEIVETIFGDSTQKKYWEHTNRVLSYVKLLGSAEDANMEVLIPATLLHDVGMTIDSSFLGHVKKSQLLSKGILKNIDYTEQDVQLIIKIIGSHHPVPGADLETIEEQILYDADNMDIIGIFGVLRWVGTFPATTKELESSIDMFLNITDKCINARGSLFYTKSAREFGDETVKSTISYYQKLKEQIKQFSSLENPLLFNF